VTQGVVAQGPIQRWPSWRGWSGESRSRVPHVPAAIRPMPETRWQCIDFCGRTPAAG